MSCQHCLLCLQISVGDKAVKFEKIGIEILYELLAPKIKFPCEPKFAEDGICEFCQDCYPLINQVEELRHQISSLENQVRTKIGQIRATIIYYSSSLQKNTGEKTMQIRDKILHLTGENVENDNNNFPSDDIQVKEEFDDFLSDVAIIEDQSLHTYPSYPTGTRAEDELEDDDSAFCIIPCSQQKKQRGRPRSTKRKLPPRKRQDSEDEIRESANPKIISKRIKLQSGELIILSELELPQPPKMFVEEIRSTRLTRKSASASKKSASISNSESEEDANPELDDDDDDWAPETGDANTEPSSEDEGEEKTDCTISSTKCSKSSTSNSDNCIPCPVALCSLVFRTHKDKDAHLKLSHKDFVPYPCRICDRKFTCQTVLASHMVILHETGKKKFSCVKCAKSFCLEENFERHMKLHEVEGIKPLICDVCDSRFADKNRLERHMETHNNKKFRCKHCGNGYNDTTSLERHLGTHIGDRPLNCPHCEAKWSDRTTLQRHISRVHSAGPQHICHICGKGYHILPDLKMHLKRHDGKLRIICDTCGDTFGGETSLQSHRIKEHGDDPVVCDECAKTFTSLEGLRRHKKIHKGIKPYKCETCDACFVRKQNLDTHILSHSEERSFVCPHCEKTFKNKRSLTTHVKGIHASSYVAPSPHKCPQCSREFRISSFLEAHIRQIHTGDRPFTCNQCGKGFAVEHALTMHLKGTHGVVVEKGGRVQSLMKDAIREEQEEGNA